MDERLLSRRAFLAAGGGALLVVAAGGAAAAASRAAAPLADHRKLSALLLASDLYASPEPQRIAFALAEGPKYASGPPAKLAYGQSRNLGSSVDTVLHARGLPKRRGIYTAEVTLPQEEVKPEPPRPLPQPEHARPTAPPRQRVASTAVVTAWNVSITRQIEQHKGYPRSALSRRETGVTQVVFAIDRDGRVLDSHVMRSSGHKALDQEAIDTLQRAQPFPAPPENLAGERFEFAVPVRFNVASR